MSATYFYRDNSGKEIGPLDLAALAKLHAVGMLNNNTPARLENSTEWKSLREFLPSSPLQQASPKFSNISIRWTWVCLLVAVAIVFFAKYYAAPPHEAEAKRSYYKQINLLNDGINLVNFKETSGRSFMETNSSDLSTTQNYEIDFEAEIEFERDVTIRGVTSHSGDHERYAGKMIGVKTEGGWRFGAPYELHILSASNPLLLSQAENDETLSQANACVNNLKQIGLAFRIWEGDHGDKYPFNVGIASGGTMEYCDRTLDGFDKNTFLHLQVMSNELAATKVLLCPSDSKRPAIDFAHLRPENVSYLIHSGLIVNDSNPREVLAICPTHHVVVLTDGSVMQVSPQRMSEIETNVKTEEAVSRANTCINNLRQIDGAISEWALETGKSVGTIPTMTDVQPYIKLNANGEVPSCPSGGTYTLHPVGSYPQVTCSIPGHVLP